MPGKVPKTRTDLAPISEIKKVTEPIKQENVAGVQINPVTEETLRASGIIAARIDKSYVDFCYVEPNIAQGLVKATTPVIYNVTMTNLDEEYSQALPANTKKYTIQTRDGTAFRIAFETGKVATPTEPYFSIGTDGFHHEDLIEPASLTLFFACGEAAKVVEIIAWS